MTREEIMQMDERELYERVLWFLNPTNGPWGGDETRRYNDSLAMVNNKSKALWLCYQAERRLGSMGLQELYADNLSDLLPPLKIDPRGTEAENEWKIVGIFGLVHASPIDRARAILMTVEENEGKQMGEELKPCPWCGRKPTTEHYHYYGSTSGWYEVGCPKCDVWREGNTEEEAIKAWNRRANEQD